MQDWAQTIIALVSGGVITTAMQRINLLKADKRKGNAEAEKQELENDDVRFVSYKATINDLNERMADALARMRELEDALNKSNATIIDLKYMLVQEQANVKALHVEIEDLRKENESIKKENEKLQAIIDEGK